MKYIKKFENKTIDEISSKLIESIERCDMELFLKCLDDEADVNYYRHKDDTFPLMATVSTERISKMLRDIRYQMAKLLLEKGADPNQKDINDFTSLTVASEPTPYDEIILLLLEYDADWYFKDHKGLDFLEILKTNNYFEIVDDIIEKFPEKYKEYLIKKDAEKYNL